MHVVLWQSRLKDEPAAGLANGWRWNVQYFENRGAAIAVYNCLVLPEPDCKVLYKDVTIADVLSRKE